MFLFMFLFVCFFFSFTINSFLVFFYELGLPRITIKSLNILQLVPKKTILFFYRLKKTFFKRTNAIFS